MRTAVVFYSLTGTTKNVCEKVAQRLDADLVELTCATPYPTSGFSCYFKGGKDALLGRKPALNPYEFEDGAYDLVVVAVPIWAGKPAAPLATFLSEHSLAGARKAGIVVSGGTDERYPKTLRRLTNEDALPVLQLYKKDFAEDGDADEKIAAFCKQISA